MRVSRLLGHANATITLNVYSHMLPKEHYGSADRLEQLVFGGESGNKMETNRAEAERATRNSLNLVARGGISLGNIGLDSLIFPRFGVTQLPRKLPFCLNSEESQIQKSTKGCDVKSVKPPSHSSSRELTYSHMALWAPQPCEAEADPCDCGQSARCSYRENRHSNPSFHDSAGLGKYSSPAAGNPLLIA